MTVSHINGYLVLYFKTLIFIVFIFKCPTVLVHCNISHRNPLPSKKINTHKSLSTLYLHIYSNSILSFMKENLSFQSLLSIDSSSNRHLFLPPKFLPFMLDLAWESIDWEWVGPGMGSRKQPSAQNGFRVLTTNKHKTRIQRDMMKLFEMIDIYLEPWLWQWCHRCMNRLN